MSFSDSRGFNTIKKLLAIASIKVGEANNYIKFTQVYIYIYYIWIFQNIPAKNPQTVNVYLPVFCIWLIFTVHVGIDHLPYIQFLGMWEVLFLDPFLPYKGSLWRAARLHHDSLTLASTWQIRRAFSLWTMATQECLGKVELVTYTPRKIFTAGTWDYLPPGKRNIHLPNDIMFRFYVMLIFGGVVLVVWFKVKSEE